MARYSDAGDNSLPASSVAFDVVLLPEMPQGEETARDLDSSLEKPEEVSNSDDTRYVDSL